MNFKHLNNNISLVPADTSFADMLLDYHLRNKSFLQPFEPERKDDFFTKDSQTNILKQEVESIKNGTGYRFYIFHENNQNKIIGKIGLSSLIRGCFHSCFLGYNIDHEYINNGYMTSAVSEISTFAFKTLNLHRIEANVMPHNKPSLRVLQKCGFCEEGLAKKYLLINSVWEDHIHMVKINEEYKNGGLL